MRGQTTPYTVTGTDGRDAFRTKDVPAYNGAFLHAETERRRLRAYLDAQVEIHQGETRIALWRKIGGKWQRVPPDSTWLANA